jgi:glucokinase
MLLTADVGATKTALAAVSDPDNPRGSVVATETYRTRDWDGLVPLVQAFLDAHGLDVDQAAVGLPGPVVAGTSHLTNLSWEVSEERLKEGLGLEAVTVLNDLEATAQAVPWLREQGLETIREGHPVEHGTIGVVAPGTGLGEAFLTWDGTRYRSYPSEGGHRDFAPRNAVQRDLLEYLSERLPHVSYERVCSGSAVPHLYAFLRDTGRGRESRPFAERLRAADDPTALIFEAGRQDDRCPLCRQTVDLFVEILGAQVGNLALTLFSTGGVYLAGGIPPRIVGRLREPDFLQAVIDKGRMAESELVERLAVHVVTEDRVALVGLAHAATRRRGDRKDPG